MSRISKNLLIAFALVSAIVLIVFCFQLILLNRDSGDGDGQSISSPANTGDGEEDGDGDGKKTPDKNQPGADGQPTDGGELSEPTETPTGTRLTRQVSGDLNLVLYVDESLFEEHMLNDGYMYEYTSGGTATLEVALVHLPMGVEARARDYLDGYTGAGGTVVVGEERVGRSRITGIHLTGAADDELYEAWLYSSTDDDEWGVAFVLHYRNDLQKAAIYEILDSMELVR